MKSVIEALGNILSYLNPFSDNFIGKKIVELLGDLLKFLFVPDEDSLNDIVYNIKSKFDFVDTIKYAINDMQDILHNLHGTPHLTIDIESKYYTGELTILDLSWYAKYKTYGDYIITGFIYILFLWRLFIKLPDIIAGTGGTLESGARFNNYIEGGRK